MPSSLLMEDSDFGSESSSSYSSDLETELYSVLHYHALSGDIPSGLLEKYDIRRNENEFFISLKKSNNPETCAFQDRPAPQSESVPENSENLTSNQNKGNSVSQLTLPGETLNQLLKDRSDSKETPVRGSSLKQHSKNLIIEDSTIIKKRKKKRRAKENKNKVHSVSKQSEGIPVSNVRNIIPSTPKQIPNIVNNNFITSTPSQALKSGSTQSNDIITGTPKRFCVVSVDDETISTPVLLNSSDNLGEQSSLLPSEEGCILISGDSSDSDVIIQEQVHEVTYISSASSNSDSVEILSDPEEAGTMLLNTINTSHSTIFPEDQGEEEVIKVKWREVSSPSTWTENMKRYYNRPSKRLKNFDCLKVLQEIKGKGSWEINADDLFPVRRKVRRCTRCRQTDHVMKDCPKRFSNCSMCGDPGHSDNFCPHRMCLNCGRKNPVFIAMCHRCESAKYQKCNECNQVGHTSSNCPDTWRRYHSTTGGEMKVKHNSVNEKLLCCNCGEKGHLFEDCRNLFWSHYPPTSFLVKKHEELDYSGSGHQGFKHSPESRKKKRRSGESSSSSYDYQGTTYNNQPSTYDRQQSTFDYRLNTFDYQKNSFAYQQDTFNRQLNAFTQQQNTFNHQQNNFNHQQNTFNRQLNTFNRQLDTFSHQNNTPKHQRSTNRLLKKLDKPKSRRARRRYFNKMDQISPSPKSDKKNKKNKSPKLN